MNKKLLRGLGPLLVIAAFAVLPALAQAETKTLVSSAANSLCVNPTEPGFDPVVNGAPNYAGLTTAHSGAFPDTGSACASGFPTNAVAVAGPGEPAGPWLDSIPDASWVGFEAGGNELKNEASETSPRYYIYDETFEVCEDQIENSTLVGEWMADNRGGAFLNGEPIGTNETFPGQKGNWNGPYATFTKALKVGQNTLQFVVLDEGGLTGLDFRATVTSAVSCEPPPHWYSNGTLIPEGQAETVTTNGTLTFTRIVYEESEVTCRITDTETIENPVGGGAGRDELTAVTFSNCFIPSSGPPGNAPLCGSAGIEVIPHGLPWATQFVAGSPPSEQINGIELELKCSNGYVLNLLSGSLTPSFSGGTMTFTSSTGTLTQAGFLVSTHVLGTDSFTGPPGDQLVTAEPIYPHWYSNGEQIPGGQTEPVATSGTFSVQVPNAGKGTTVVKCKVKDEETIVNPTAGGAGTDELTQFTASGCSGKPSPCPSGSKAELLAHGLPWKTHLVAGSPIRDAIEGVDLEVRCTNGTVVASINEKLEPAVGASVLEFTGVLSASDKLTGPKGDEKITAELPGLPHWYSDGKRTAEGEVVPVATKATLSFQLPDGAGTVSCKVKDRETVTNPTGGGAGVDEFLEFTMSGCTAKVSPCPHSKLELIAQGLPWLTRLVPGPPIADVIEGADVEARCSNGTVLGTMHETLSAVVGSSVLSLTSGFMIGSDKLTGPPGDTKITARNP